MPSENKMLLQKQPIEKEQKTLSHEKNLQSSIQEEIKKENTRRKDKMTDISIEWEIG